MPHPRTLASAGHGLNLQAGGNIIVSFSMIWSLKLYMQFNARLHRQGQSKPVFVRHLVAADNLKEQVLQVLQVKRSVQEAFVKAFKT
jgi:SNF2 family DNA or RNA helicase